MTVTVLCAAPRCHEVAVTRFREQPAVVDSLSRRRRRRPKSRLGRRCSLLEGDPRRQSRCIRPRSSRLVPGNSPLGGSGLPRDARRFDGRRRRSFIEDEGRHAVTGARGEDGAGEGGGHGPGGDGVRVGGLDGHDGSSRVVVVVGVVCVVMSRLSLLAVPGRCAPGNAPVIPRLTGNAGRVTVGEWASRYLARCRSTGEPTRWRVGTGWCLRSWRCGPGSWCPRTSWRRRCGPKARPLPGTRRSRGRWSGCASCWAPRPSRPSTTATGSRCPPATWMPESSSGWSVARESWWGSASRSGRRTCWGRRSRSGEERRCRISRSGDRVAPRPTGCRSCAATPRSCGSTR